MIHDLPLLAPDAARGAETRTRCHHRLAARRQRLEWRNRPAEPAAIVAERLLFAGVCMVYLISMAGNLLRMIGPR